MKPIRRTLAGLTVVMALATAGAALPGTAAANRPTDPPILPVNVKILPEAPAMAMGNLYQTAGGSIRPVPGQPGIPDAGTQGADPCEPLASAPDSLYECVTEL